jgi:tRNA A37 methylthiotransferase MiaB
LLNSCTVKDPSQAAFMNLVKLGNKMQIPSVVAGCVPQGEQTLKGLEKVSMVGVLQVDRVVEVVEQTLNGNVVQLMEKGRLPRLDLPKVLESTSTSSGVTPSSFSHTLPLPSSHARCNGSCVLSKDTEE